MRQLLALLVVFGCSDDSGGADAGAGDGSATVDGRSDASVDGGMDASVPTDGAPVGDAGEGRDGSVPDGGADATGADVGAEDADLHGDVVSLVIEPSVAVIEVMNGNSTPAAFEAIATFEDGHSEAVGASWMFDRPDLAMSDPGSGTVTALGNRGGAGMLSASYDGLSATAAVSVFLHIVENRAEISQSEIDVFATPDGVSSGDLLYPYDQTVFPRNVLPPELMWSGGADDDLYEVELSEPYVDVKIYTRAPNPSAVLMNRPQWTVLVDNNNGSPLEVRITRQSGSQAHAPMEQTWTIAQGSLLGSLYYWAVNVGQSLRLTLGDETPSPVFDAGSYLDLGGPAPAGYDNTVPPWSEGANGGRCVACHTVSLNGERFVGVFQNKNAAPSPWGTVDLASEPPQVVQMSPYDSQTLFLALTPNGDYVVHNDLVFTLHLADADTGGAIASVLDAYTGVAHPEFSPDGSMLAFSSDVVGSYPVEFSRANLDVVDFDPTTRAFSNRRQLVNAGTDAIAFPSFAPDSAWIVYQRGDYSRAKYGAGSVGHDNLYITDVAAQVGQIALDNANGVGVLDASNLNLNYQPRVHPIAVGGYYWIVFFSPRDYGNKLVSSGNPTYQNRKQLWVAAVDVNPQPGSDPSHPAFYLDGQDLTTINMEGYWALDACLPEGDSCAAGYECCTGFCRPNQDGELQCSPPSGCAQSGEACQTSADCCGADAQCIGGFC